MVIEKFFVTVDEAESVTCTMKLYVPEATGVPDITPPELRFSPVGRLPELNDQAYGVMPPEAASVWLYGVSRLPDGRGDEVVMANASTVKEAVTVQSAVTGPVV
jgi:hypothetical protein